MCATLKGGGVWQLVMAGWVWAEWVGVVYGHGVWRCEYMCG